MPYLLAIVAAACFGAADFIGGLSARRAHTSAVVVVSGGAGLALLALLLPALPAGAPSQADFFWGAVAGIAGGAAVALLYHALAIGTMSVVAPTTAVCGVAIPVVAGLARGERPSPLTTIGMALALVAIVLVSQEARGAGSANGQVSPPSRRALGIALLSGVGIGLFYLTLAETSHNAGLWPLLPAKVVTVVMFALLAAGRGEPLQVGRPLLRLVIAGGLLDMAANVFYLLATRGGPLSVVVTLASLYPASTVVLARVLLGERLSVPQVAGVLSAFVAVVLILGAT